MGISRDSMHKRRATGGKKKAWRKKRKYELGRQPANTKLSSNKTVRRIRVRGGNVKWRALRLDTGNFSWGSEAVTRKTRLLDVVYNASNNEYELGRQPANTKLSSNKTVRRIRVRGGNVKWRALRLDTGNFSWGSEAVTRKTRLLDVVYNASNNELVRTQTLVKSAIVQVDAAPFRQWYLQHYGVEIGRKKKTTASTKKEGEEGEAAAAAATTTTTTTTTTTEEVKKSNHVQRKLEKRQQNRKLDSHIEEQFGGGRLLACISSRPGQCGRADGYILEGKELEFYMKKIQRKKGKAGAA
nr:40s ribosomal protein s8 [Quercus suber]